MTFNFLAHVKQTSDENWHEHALEEHLNDVANLASEFAQSFKASEWAYLAGLWHDLGKYSNDFQQKIRKSSGYESDLKFSITYPKDSQHTIIGAIYFIKKFEELIAKCSPALKEKFDFIKHIISHAIAGHHGG